MRSITGASSIAAMIFSSPPQFGQCSRSISKTRLSSRAQLIRAGLRCAQFGSHAAGCAAAAGSSGPCGTTLARNSALGASTPCKRIRCGPSPDTNSPVDCLCLASNCVQCQALFEA